MATSIDDKPTRQQQSYEKNFPPQVATRYFISLLLELLLFVLIRSFALTPALSSVELLSANQQQMLNQNNKRSFSRWIQKHRWEREEKTFLIAFLALLLLRLDSLSPTLKKIPTVSSVDQKHSCILHVPSRVIRTSFFLACEAQVKRLALDYYDFEIFVEMCSRLIIFGLECR